MRDQVAPRGIELFNQLKFPCAFPAFHPVFSFSRFKNRFIPFETNELIDAISAGEAWNRARFVFSDTTGKIAGDPDVQRAISSAKM